MTIRSSISISTSSIRDALKEVCLEHFRGNASAYLEELLINDLVKRGYKRKELMYDTEPEKENTL